ncbi:MAG: SDR family oxidoreductase [Polyangiaceae bacterium]|nr:SDR family oxidoreductase [Polyangiaceae bacterium]MCB9605805.1 SDR family oxidoreductase [Polyangiaceae bacterium]
MPDISGKTVVVTGGSGFIGSHLVDGLLSRGAEVRVLDNFETGRRENLSHVQGKIELIEGDIRDLATCQRALEGANFVLHQAALGSVPRSMATPANSLATNVGGTANIFTAARDQKLTRVVYASSSSVYGTSDKLPKKEGEEGEPMSPYALSKWMNEELAATYTRCYPMEFVGLRYFNVYGPRQDPNGAYAAVIPRFFAACRKGEAPVIFGDGLQSRDFTYIDDVVRANLLAMTMGGAAGSAYNIGAGGRTTVKDLAETIIKVTGFAGAPSYQDPRPGDVKHSMADASRAKSGFGWEATTDLESGLARAAEYYS